MANDNLELGLWTVNDYAAYVDKNRRTANSEQQRIITEVTDAAEERVRERNQLSIVKKDMSRLFFITGDGGTGKTYTYNVQLPLIILFTDIYSSF